MFDFEWDNWLSWGLSLVCSLLMYVMMFESGLWDSIAFVSRLFILVIGVPLYYVVACVVLERMG